MTKITGTLDYAIVNKPLRLTLIVAIFKFKTVLQHITAMWGKKRSIVLEHRISQFHYMQCIYPLSIGVRASVCRDQTCVHNLPDNSHQASYPAVAANKYINIITQSNSLFEGLHDKCRRLRLKCRGIIQGVKYFLEILVIGLIIRKGHTNKYYCRLIYLTSH